MTDDPFTLLGLPARPGLTDDDVRAAWRRIAAATHPDREDGGDPVRFGAAAAAYVILRTSFGRGEALADLAADLAAGHRARSGLRPGRVRASRLRHGRPRPSRQRPAGLRPSGPRLSTPRHCEARRGDRRNRVFSRGERQGRRGAHRVETDGAGAGLTKGYRAGAWHLAWFLGRLTGFLGRLTTGRGPGVRGPGVRGAGVRGAGVHGSGLPGSALPRPGMPGAGVRGLGLRVASAALLAAATVAAVGVTPATIGLLAGALTVTGWALWRRGGWNR